MTSLSSVSKKLFRYLLLAVFSVSTSVGVNAASCPDDNAVALSWLDKMSRSLRQANYHGVVTLQRDGDMQVMQVSHIVGDGSSSERLVELTGRGAQVERLSHPLDCIHPGDRLLRGEVLLPEKSCGIATHYRFAVTPGERVAGREVVRIVIEPRDIYRFGYVVDLDEETGIMLKARIVQSLIVQSLIVQSLPGRDISRPGLINLAALLAIRRIHNYYPPTAVPRNDGSFNYREYLLIQKNRPTGRLIVASACIAVATSTGPGASFHGFVSAIMASSCGGNESHPG